MDVYAINLTLNLLLSYVVLTHVTTRSSESTDSFIVKLLHINAPICDFETLLTGLDYQLWLI